MNPIKIVLNQKSAVDMHENKVFPLCSQQIYWDKTILIYTSNKIKNFNQSEILTSINCTKLKTKKMGWTELNSKFLEKIKIKLKIYTFVIMWFS